MSRDIYVSFDGCKLQAYSVGYPKDGFGRARIPGE
jgi:hypothetical protein